MYLKPTQSRSAKAKSRPANEITLGPWPLGINKVLGLAEIGEHELAEAVNFKYNLSGGLEIREGISRYTSTALANAAIHIGYFPFQPSAGSFALFYDSANVVFADTSSVVWVSSVPASTQSDELVVTQNDNKLYFLDGNKSPVYITTLAGEATILPIGGYAMILDGSYIKLFNKSSGAVTLAYDDGTGAHGYQANNLALTADTVQKLFAGDVVMAGLKFTTQAWDSGYTITATEVKAYLSKLGAPDGNVGCKIYESDGDALATSTTIIVATDLDVTPELITFEFASGALEPATEYWAVITYSGGDTNNCVQIECDTVASGGTLKFNDGSWDLTATLDPLIGVKPGRPPKAQFGLVRNLRAYVAGDPDNPGYVWYCNTTGPFDWSTADGGGYVGAVDDNAMNYAVGAISTIYNDLYVFGKAAQPFLAKLTGDSPSDYALPSIFQEVSGSHKTTINAVNDIWFGNKSGIDSLSGVEQYGDLRTFSLSDSVKTLIDSYWNESEAFACYNPMDGQDILKLPIYARCLVGHTKKPVQGPDGHTRYPFTEYAFVRDVLTDSAIYKWVASGSGTNEYYLDLLAGGDPSVTEPAFLMMDDTILTPGAVGSLADHGWDYGDNDTLGYSTIYVRDDTGDPDSSGVQIRSLLKPTGFASYSDMFLICMDDGYIYKLDSTVVKDNGEDVPYALGSALVKVPFAELCIDRYHLMAESEGTATISLQLLNKGKRVDALAGILPISGTPDISVSVGEDEQQEGVVNWNANKFQLYLRELDPNDQNLRVSGVKFETSVLSK